ncbi:G-type lectin S-receptor-like serine/threonine-protein kinase At2g19130 [Papaver somniferum]|uniref:G-type lectin S-receptor-like serine/threonine-protein kinase At2g19130 n=1 Tax=Papaver somniferum TaxID=3469 RepID=UPI000E6FD18F|nr:G-type lectin S-receptor-like serine/threonine-protein kinase At2g19130 [Papaver somniferum]
MGFLHVNFLYFVFLLVFTNSVQVTAQEWRRQLHYCQGGNYTNNSPFEKNLNKILASLSSSIKPNKAFYNMSVGKGLDRVYGMLLRIGGFTERDCKICANYVTESATRICPNGKEYAAWKDECMLRYSNRSIFSVMETEPEVSEHTSNFLVDTQFPRLVKQLMTRLVSNASSDVSNSTIINFASRNITYTNTTIYGTMSIYGLVQCTPDISRTDCERCLLLGVDKVFRLYPPGSDQGGDMTTTRPSCYMKVEFYPLYNVTAANPPSLSPPARPRKSTALWVSLATVILIFAIICLCKLLVRGAKEKLHSKTRDGTLVAFTYRELQTVMKNFSQKLGGGGFGSVFKGMLPDSTYIAVKKLEALSQGAKQFRSEVSTIGMIQHVNLVRLRGFCSEGDKRLLVYEFMPNGSLDSHLFHHKSTEVLNWKTRYQIALRTARGLAYLHEKCRDSIIHSDIKPENILLDAEFHPKIADFGLAKLVSRDFSRVLTTVRGTRGYLAPEWISGVAITPKADVYSYGMMLFEIISGKRNFEPLTNDEKVSYFPAWAATKMNEGDDIISLVDNRLKVNADILELTRACRVACWCIQDDEAHRPSMGQVVHILEGLSDVKRPPIPRSLHFLVENQDNVFFFLESSNRSSQARTNTTSFGSVPDRKAQNATSSMGSEYT